MKPEDNRLSSKQLLEKIGCNTLPDSSLGLLDDDELEGDLAISLRERYHQLKLVKHTLRPGMVVTWKPGLRNLRWPAYGKPCIVVSMLDTPVFENDDTGSTYFREPLDITFGIFVDEGKLRGEFFVFHGNSERYQPWPGEEG